VFRRIAVLLCITGALALSSPAAQAADDRRDAARDPVTLVQQRLDEARAQATDIAGRISAAQSQQAKLEGEIAETEARIPVLRAKATELRAVVKARAAQLYMRHGASNAFEATMEAENAQDGLRAAHLTNTIGSADLDTATELRETATRLVAHEAALRQQRADLERSLAELAPLNELLQRKLEVATALYDKVRALVVDPVDKRGANVATEATVCPVRGFVVFTSDFGELRPAGPHLGVDLAALPETPVVAVTGGVWRHDISAAGGNGAWLTGWDGMSYYYAHFSRYEGPGGLVNAGDVIGYVGSTGNSTGPHLHFEIHPGQPSGLPVDPFATLLALCDENLPTLRAN
jgi:murein DD-endopeptidase MepM/ murein hydrolase activator NlpD